jgi:hypothetical protein
VDRGRDQETRHERSHGSLRPKLILAVANYIYRLPREKPTPIPYALSIGLDWLEFQTPPYAGGLVDQPMHLMRNIRTALSTYQTINAYRTASASLNAESFSKYCNQNPQMMKLMQQVWDLQDEANNKEPDHANNG